jgi:hypothetical protein
MLLTDPQAPTGSPVDWLIDDIGTDREGGPVAWYTTDDGTVGTHQFEDPTQLLTVRRGGNGSGRLFGRLRRGEADGDQAAADALPAAAPGTLNDPVIPESAADIDPSRAPMELCAATVTAQEAVVSLCAGHPGLSVDLPWRYRLDGAFLDLDQVEGPDEWLTGLVYLLAWLFTTEPQQRHREPADGYSRLTVTGTYEGVLVAVGATVTPALADGLDRIYGVLDGPAGRIPELDTPIALPPGEVATDA